nr:MAG TPA: hypothetical protein [Caudoviricetes sp.]
MLSLRIQSRDITAAKRYNSYKISIASPILTGVGMPVWKAAKMRAFSKRRSATGSV